MCMEMSFGTLLLSLLVGPAVVCGVLRAGGFMRLGPAGGFMRGSCASLALQRLNLHVAISDDAFWVVSLNCHRSLIDASAR